MDYRIRLSMMVGDARDSGRIKELLDAIGESLAELTRASEPQTPREKPKAERSQSEQYWRAQVQQHHPDKGGDPELFRQAKANLDAVRGKSTRR